MSPKRMPQDFKFWINNDPSPNNKKEKKELVISIGLYVYNINYICVHNNYGGVYAGSLHLVLNAYSIFSIQIFH